VQNLVLQSGFTANGFGARGAVVNISADSFQLPYSPAISLGQWQLMPERGDTIAQWIERLWSDYASTWIRGWMPATGVYQYKFLSPNSLSNTAQITLYQSRADARAQGVPQNLVHRRVVRTMTEMPEPPEANQILVVGFDRRTGRYVTAQADDAASQNAATAVASRPNNWLGNVWRYQLIDPGVSNQDAANRAAQILSERLTTGRNIITWTSDLLQRNTAVENNSRVLWKGDAVAIRTLGSPASTYGTYRILAIPSIEFTWDPNANVRLYTATYTGLKVG
jgi:hypothetical protein